MEMMLTHLSLNQLAMHIKNHQDWLTEERLHFLIHHRPELFNHLNVSDIHQPFLLNILTHEDSFFHFIKHFQAYKNDSWRALVTSLISYPLDFRIFNERSSLLDYLEVKDYSALAKDWLKKQNHSTIPPQLHLLLTPEQLITQASYPSFFIDFGRLDPALKTLPFCLTYFKTRRQDLEREYPSLPDAVKDHPDIAYWLCEQDKQNYKKLSDTAKKNEAVISYVTYNVLRSTSDNSSDEKDPCAIPLRELSMEAIRSIHTLDLIQRIFRGRPQVCKDPILQEKWFKNHSQWKELVEFFTDPKEISTHLTQDSPSLSIQDKASLMLKNKLTIPLIYPHSSLEHQIQLMALFQQGKKFDLTLQKLALPSVWIQHHLTPVTNHYIQEINARDHSFALSNGLQLASWLFTQKNPDCDDAACQIMSHIILKQGVKNFMMSRLDYLYGGVNPRVLIANENKIYHYMDTMDYRKKNKLK